MTATTNPQAVFLWHQKFRNNNEFYHPNTTIANGKTDMPPIFEFFPEAKDMFVATAKENLEHLTIKLLHNKVINNIIPSLWKKSEKTKVDKDILERRLLLIYKDTPPSYRTVCLWMKKLGFGYNTCRKSYYVDRHKKPAQKFHIKEFTK